VWYLLVGSRWGAQVLVVVKGGQFPYKRAFVQQKQNVSLSLISLQIASMSSVFLLSSDYYDEAGHIFIHKTSPTGLVFAKVPIQFLRKGGLNNWDFVLAITNMLVDPVPSCPGTIRTTTGDPNIHCVRPQTGITYTSRKVR